MSDLSVITLVKNRGEHLQRLLAGLQRSDLRPSEVIVVDMSDPPLALLNTGLPLTTIRMRTVGLPLAAARNRGAEAASGQHLLFLDVDCIAQHDLLAAMHRALAHDDALICAEVRYLGPGSTALVHEDALTGASVLHPHRQFPSSGLHRETNFGLFWSLVFGIRRESFWRLNGFDEGYEGYGAEDTDFGFRADEAGLPLLFLGGTGAFHQYHGVLDPPLQHFDDIVRNANRFFERWRIWPMRDWLESFAALGLVARHDESIVVLRTPTPGEIDAARKPAQFYF